MQGYIHWAKNAPDALRQNVSFRQKNYFENGEKFHAKDVDYKIEIY